MWYNTNVLEDHAAFIFRANMEAASSCGTMVSYHIITQGHNPEDHDLNLHCCENLKSHTM
jgi:hypothetical protein